MLNGANSAEVLLECPSVVADDAAEPDVEGLLPVSMKPSASVLVQIQVEAYMFTLLSY